MANGRQVRVGIFDFTNVVVPSGVAVRFQGFDIVLLQSSGDMTINGVMNVSGTDGKSGTFGQGGDGGNGGMAQGTAPVGGSAGLGGYAWDLMAICNTGCNRPGLGGDSGTGQNPFLSPGRPRLQLVTVDRPCSEPGSQSFFVGGGSGAGGGNGSRGADGQGQIVIFFEDDDDLRYFQDEIISRPQRTAKSKRSSLGAGMPITGRGQRLQDDDDDPPIPPTWGEYFKSVGGPSFGQPTFTLNIQSAGSGDGGDGPATLNSHCGDGPLGGGGGGGGGSGGAIFLQAQGKITINAGGAIRANGGNGGNGAPDTFSGGGGGGAGGFIRLEAQLVQMNGGVLEAHGGRGGLGQEGAFNGGAGGGGRILIVGPVACAVPVTEAIMAASAETISCPAQDLAGRDASGDQIVGLPTVVAEQQQAQMTIDPFSFVAKDGEATVTIKVSGQASATVNLSIELKSGKGQAQFKSNNQTSLGNLQVTSSGTSVVIKGIEESDTKDNLLLKATPTSTTVTGAERSFSVVAIKKVEWVNEGQLGGNTHPSGTFGLRVFPDAPASGGQAQNKVKVKATITPVVEKVEVFFRSIDVDDPSSSNPDLDDDSEGHPQDNRACLRLQPPHCPDPVNDGKFTGATNQTSKKTNTDGEADVVLETTMQPGDNFRVIATCISKDIITGDKVKAVQGGTTADVKDSADKVISDDKTTAASIKASEVLTVWRYLHVEVDSMTDPPDPKLSASATNPVRNFIKGDIVGIEGTGNQARRLTLAPQVTNPLLGLDDGSPNLSMTGPNSGKGRFENGTITIGAGSSAVSIRPLDGNGVDFVEKKSGLSIPFQLVDSNGRNPIPANPSQQISITRMDLTNKEFTISESVRNVNYAGGTITIGGVKFTVMSAKGPNITVMEEPKLPFLLMDDDATSHPFTVDTSLMQKSVDPALNLFAPAYIQPVYDLGPGSKQLGFNRNVEDDLKEIQDQLESGREKVSTNEYWVAYIQGAFQGPTVPTPNRSADADPNIEGGIGGATPTYDTDPPSDLRQGSLIFVEVIRDRGVVLRAAGRCLNINLLAQNTLHEVGHQFGLDEGGGIMGLVTQGGCVPLTDQRFLPADSATIRKRSHP